VEFDRVAAQTAAVERELNTWQNATIHILKRFLLENPALLLEAVQDKLQILQYQNQIQQDKTDRLLEELATLKNNSMEGMILVLSSGKHRNEAQSCVLAINYMRNSCLPNVSIFISTVYQFDP